jgi:Zn-dependent oligopeptidase
LQAKLRPYADQEKVKLLGLLGKGTSGPLPAWDYQYGMELLRKRDFELNEDEVAEYFPLDHVVNGIFDIYSRVFLLKFERKTDAVDRWHPDVDYFEVTDASSGEFLGSFYMDMYPREGKYKHAAVFPLSYTHVREDGSRSYPVAGVVCNFTRATASKPSLLKHSEVVTFLHEFGHCVHNFVSRTQYARFAGTSVVRDIVEAPSQQFENWGWQVDGLRKLSKHFQSGQPMPDALMQRLIKSRTLCAGLVNSRQLFFGLYDMYLHSTTPEEAQKIDTAKLWSEMRTEITRVQHTEGTSPAAGFGHIMGGYQAGYYGYMYSLVYACDMFSKFLESGDIFSSEVGMKLRGYFLSRGGEADEESMIKKFLGRDLDNRAFLENIGLLVKS